MGDAGGVALLSLLWPLTGSAEIARSHANMTIT